MARRLIVTAHWSEAGNPEDIDDACDVMRPLKAEGTEGHAWAFDEEVGQQLLDELGEIVVYEEAVSEFAK